jgi:hypothetical protein
VLGGMIGGALVGTFMGVLMAYQPVDEVGVQSNGSAWMLTTRTAA